MKDFKTKFSLFDPEMTVFFEILHLIHMNFSKFEVIIWSIKCGFEDCFCSLCTVSNICFDDSPCPNAASAAASKFLPSMELFVELWTLIICNALSVLPLARRACERFRRMVELFGCDFAASRKANIAERNCVSDWDTISRFWLLFISSARCNNDSP